MRIKKFNILLLLVFSVFLLYGCSVTQNTTSSTNTTSYAIGYSDFASIHITDVSQQLSMPEGTYYLYYYGISCENCNDIKSQVFDKLNSLQTDTIYLILTNKIGDVHPAIDVTATPSLVKVVNGDVAAIYRGKVEVVQALSDIF